MDSQSLLLDALDHSKEEIRSHYETYVNRIDTPLLVLALIWPFALNTIQFSDPFVPQSKEECPHCLEARYPWLVVLWVGSMGVILILPFWGILMLIRCKLKLDSWLEYSLAGLNRERRPLILKARDAAAAAKRQEDHGFDIEGMVAQLVDVVLAYQDYLARIWTAECGWLVHVSTMLLWMSAVAALFLTALSMVIFLNDKGGVHAESAQYFAVLIASGLVLPAVYVVQQRLTNTVRPPDGDPDDLHQAAFPLCALRAQKAPGRSQSMSFKEGSQRRAPRELAFTEEDERLGAANGMIPASWLRCCRRRSPHPRALMSPLLRASTKSPGRD
jgi:hypothetical protein